MQRVLLAAVVLTGLSSGCFAQMVSEVKPTKLGTGCETPVTPLGTRLGTCSLNSNRARIWCPDGKVFERTGTQVQAALARSICGLNQAL